MSEQVLAELALLKRYLGIPAEETSEDDLLGSFLEQATRLIQTYCGRELFDAERDEELDGGGTDRLVLTEHPVTELVSVEEDGREIPATELVLYANEGLLVRDGAVFSKGSRNVLVTYRAGYAAVPEDLELACLKTAASLYARAKAGADGVLRQSFGAYSAEYGPGLPREVESLIAAYGNPAAG